MAADATDQSPNEPTEHKALSTARQLLHKRFKVVVKDGRVLVGDFLCIDKQGNLILGNTYQQVDSQLEPYTERPIGQVLVPATQRVSCHVEVMPNEEQSMKDLLEVRCRLDKLSG